MDIRSLIPFGLAFGAVTILLSLVANIVTNVQTTQTAGSYSYNVSGYGLSGLNSLGSQLPTIGLVLGAAVIIGTLVMAFAFKNQ